MTLISFQQACLELDLPIERLQYWAKKGLIKTVKGNDKKRYVNSVELTSASLSYLSVTDEKEIKPIPFLTRSFDEKLSSIELFAGAGGLALGLGNAGFEHQVLVEIDGSACSTLRYNQPSWQVLEADVRRVDFKAFHNKVDVVTGGFPCQAFSYAGHKLGFKDTRGTLFYELARCIKEVNPKIVVGENVRGLLQHHNGQTLQTMLSVMDELGYDVAYKVLKAQYYDVAQKRERLVIIGVRKDLNRKKIIFAKEKPYTCALKNALKDVPSSEGQRYPLKKYEVLKQVPEGGCWRHLPEAVQKIYMGKSFFQGGGKTGVARRLAWNEPSLTLTCAPAQKQTERCHPTETRPLTVREYARIQTFPDSWQFQGSLSAQYKQIGNAVPVNLGFYIGMSVRATLGLLAEDETIEFVEGIYFQEQKQLLCTV